MNIAALNIERVPPSSVNHPHPENPRKRVKPGSPEWNTLKATMTRGYYGLIVFNRRNNKLVAGHVRIGILIEMGVDLVDVCMVDLSEEDHGSLMIGLNAHTGKDDKDKLATLLDKLKEQGADPCLALLKKLQTKQQRPLITIDTKFEVVAECTNEAEQRQVFQVLTEKGFKCRLSTF
jgi:hypothetical protein